jgi:hypothetical protein
LHAKQWRRIRVNSRPDAAAHQYHGDPNLHAIPTERGFVHFGLPGLSPATYQQLIACFVTSFQQCHIVHFVYEFFSATDQGHNELSLSGTAQNSLIHTQEHYVSTKASTPTATDYAYTCSRPDQRAGYYVITGCDNRFEINFPERPVPTHDEDADEDELIEHMVSKVCSPSNAMCAVNKRPNAFATC